MISAQQIDDLMTGLEGAIALMGGLLQASNMIVAGGEGGISAEDLAILKHRAEKSAADFAAMVGEIPADPSVSVTSPAEG